MRFPRKTNVARTVRRYLVAVVATIASVVLLAACETMSQAEQGEMIGGVVGGVVGAQIGEGHGRTAAIIIGTLAGAMIGRQIGETMDETDRTKTARVLNDSRTGTSTTWVNPDTGHEYTVTPTRTYERSSGPCREFRLDASVGDSPDEEVYGTACLQADGSWLIQ
jgi:surface antigen